MWWGGKYFNFLYILQWSIYNTYLGICPLLSKWKDYDPETNLPYYLPSSALPVTNNEGDMTAFQGLLGTQNTNPLGWQQQTTFLMELWWESEEGRRGTEEEFIYTKSEQSFSLWAIVVSGKQYQNCNHGNGRYCLFFSYDWSIWIHFIELNFQLGILFFWVWLHEVQRPRTEWGWGIL